MKGMKIFMGLLAIFLVKNQVTAASPDPSNILGVIDWGSKIFHAYTDIAPDKSDANVKKVLNDLDTLSKDLTDMDSRSNISFDQLYHSIVGESTTTIEKGSSSETLMLLIETVYKYFKDSMKYQFTSYYDRETLDKFTDKILYGNNAMPDILLNIYEIFIGGVDHDMYPPFFSSIFNETGRKARTECEAGMSLQQEIYYIYSQLVLIEMKGLVVLTETYITRSLLNKNPTNFTTELVDAHTAFETRVNTYNRVCRNAMNPIPPVVRPCQLSSPRPHIDYGELKFPSTLEEPTIESISLASQLSDIKDNKVVTGVRFVIVSNALYLQIQQGVLTKGGEVFGDKEWKPVHEEKGFGSKEVHRDLTNEPIKIDTGLNLDEIRVANHYTVVTGVKFEKPINQAVFFTIHATAFDLGTGQLKQNETYWYNSTTSFNTIDAYKRPRGEIIVGPADSPLDGKQFDYAETNNLMKFAKTKDQKTVIPFIDLQTVETEPGFALEGVGISYRESKGYSGYVAPQVYPIHG